MRGASVASRSCRLICGLSVAIVVFATLLAGPPTAGAARLGAPPSGPSIASGDPPAPTPQTPAYENSYAKDFIMDAPWRVLDANTTIPLTIILKDCDTDDIRQLHWIRCWDVTGGLNTLLWDHSFGDERIGDDATEANYWTYITTVTEGHASLPNGTLLTPANLGYGSGAAIQLKVSIYYKDNLFNYTETRYLRVHVGSGPFPWPAEWYGGDTHFHTMYTNNTAESGAPIPAVRAAASAMGLHWLITTDHSCDLDETGDGTWSYATPQWEYTLQTPAGIQTVTRDNTAYGNTWNAIGADIIDSEGPDLRLIRGEEVNLASIDSDSQNKTLHAVFANSDYVNSPWTGSLGESPVTPTVPDGLNQITGGGFAFAAHPLYNLGSAVNGAAWGDQDIAASLEYPAFLGLEAFNTREVLKSTNETNPWADFDAGSAAANPYPNELLAGITLWDGLLRSNLETAMARTINPGGEFVGAADSRASDSRAVCLAGSKARAPLRKVFLAGGSDAHGDFNYATYLSLDSYATDNAIGKVQTVAHVTGAYAPGSLPPAETIMEAVRLGRTVITDGPFVEIGLDRDDDGDWYESGDMQIGDDGLAISGPFLPLKVRWTSLPEFGPITSLRLCVGDALQTVPLLEIDPSATGQGYAGATSIDLGGFGYLGQRYFRAECLASDGGAGHRAYTNPIWVTFEVQTDVAEDRSLETMAIGRGCPNPFIDETRITFLLGGTGRIHLAIFDAGGRSVRTLLDGRDFPSGRHAIVWNGSNEDGAPVAPGVYFGVLDLNGRTLATKLQLLR